MSITASRRTGRGSTKGDSPSRVRPEMRLDVEPASVEAGGVDTIGPTGVRGLAPRSGLQTYAVALLERLRPAGTPLRDHISFRELARRVGISYEHIRKIAHGEVTFGRAVNDALCQELGLDSDAMWALSQRERLLKRFGQAGDVAVIVSIWHTLSESQRRALVATAKAMSEPVDRARSPQLAV